MEDMNAIVARNIRRLRDNRQLSLDELARLSGVSRSMLARIERGEGNPTLSTLWRVTSQVPCNLGTNAVIFSG